MIWLVDFYSRDGQVLESVEVQTEDQDESLGLIIVLFDLKDRFPQYRGFYRHVQLLKGD